MENDSWKNIEKYSENPLSSNVFYHVTKKTEKIVTAIYMVTSFIHETDPLHNHIRSNAMILLADVFSCVETHPVQQTATLSQTIVTIEHIISMLGLARQMGLISDMNTRILHKELMYLQNTLHREIHKHKKLDLHRESHTDIDQHSFLHALLVEHQQNQSETLNDINDIKMSFKDNVVNKTTYKRQQRPQRGESNKRQEQILKILKDIKSATMKDIATRITNCTEKTLQRDLATLIEQGQVEKKGARRWSTYTLKG